MLTRVANTTFISEVSMPEVDLANVQKLVQALIDIDNVDGISWDDYSNLAALLPDAVVDEIGPKMTYLPSRANLQLAQEALSSGMKVTLATVITAAIGALLAYFKLHKRKSSSGGSGERKKGATAGPGGAPNFVLTMEERREDIQKVVPIFDTEIENFHALMSAFVADRTVETIDGDLYPDLLGLMYGLNKSVEHFTSMPIPEFSRSRDKNKLGAFLATYAEALEPANLTYKWVRPANYFFLSDRDLYPHTRFLEEIFRFLKVNKSFETTIPDLTHALSKYRFQPARVDDHQAPGAEQTIKEIFDIIENDFAPKDMARAAGMQVSARSNYDTFIEIVEKTRFHIDALFGTDLYENGPGNPEVKGKAMRNYFEFLTVQGAERRGTVYLQIDEMADQCGDLLRVAQDKMLEGRHVNFLAEAKRTAEDLSKFIKMDMHNSNEDKYDAQRKQNLADLKDISLFVTSLVRFTADLTRVVDAVTRVEERMDELEYRMGHLTKILMQTNEILRKVNQ